MVPKTCGTACWQRAVDWTPPAPGSGISASATQVNCSGSAVVWTWGWRRRQRGGRQTVCEIKKKKKTDRPEWVWSSDWRAHAPSETHSLTTERSAADTGARVLAPDTQRCDFFTRKQALTVTMDSFQIMSTNALLGHLGLVRPCRVSRVNLSKTRVIWFPKLV